MDKIKRVCFRKGANGEWEVIERAALGIVLAA